METKKPLFTPRMYKTLIIWTLIAAALALLGVFIPAVGLAVNIVAPAIIQILAVLMGIGLMLYFNRVLTKAFKKPSPADSPTESAGTDKP
jgi:uncharacterized membrane protein